MKTIPVWRLREIRNIADTITFRAACCPLAAVVLVTERRLLKPLAHIRMVINPSLKPSDTHFYIQQPRRGARPTSA
jgi:hypothetical protein